MKKSRFIDFLKEEEKQEFSINFLLMEYENAKASSIKSFSKIKSSSENHNDDDYYINKYHKPISKII